MFCRRRPAILFERGSWKTFANGCFSNSAPQWQSYRTEVRPFNPFKPFITPSFALTEWFYHVTSFAKVSLSLFFSLKHIFIIKKLRHESCNIKVGSGTVAREENCHPHNCLLDDGPRIIAPPQDNNCPRREIVLWTIASRKIATPSLIAPQESCPLTIKFSSKIVAPTQATSPQRVLEYPKWTEENYGLSTNTIIKESLYRKLFFKDAN